MQCFKQESYLLKSFSFLSLFTGREWSSTEDSINTHGDSLVGIIIIIVNHCKKKNVQLQNKPKASEVSLGLFAVFSFHAIYSQVTYLGFHCEMILLKCTYTLPSNKLVTLLLGRTHLLQSIVSLCNPRHDT